jgi:hypothetical protein
MQEKHNSAPITTTILFLHIFQETFCFGEDNDEMLIISVIGGRALEVVSYKRVKFYKPQFGTI